MIKRRAKNMNDTIKTIMERYSCRDFADTPLTEEQVKILIDAALASPSAMNLQPWHIIMICDIALIDEMDIEGMNVLRDSDDQTVYNRMMERGGKLFYNAPCMMLVAKNSMDSAPLDCGILIQNVALAASSLGLGNVICGMARIPLSGSRKEEFLKRMSFPENHEFATSILIGTAKSGKEPHELDYSKVTKV